MIQWVKDNFRTLAGLGVLYVAYVEFGSGSYPDVPGGSGLAVAAAVAVAIAGYIAAQQIDGLLPDEEGVYLVAFDASDEAGGSVWELTEDQFGNMDVHAGSLFHWPTSKRVYEVREYLPEQNKAVANWRESVAGSQLAGHVTVLDALAAIKELREEFEPAAERQRHTKRHLSSLARRMDRRRDRDQQAILEGHMTPEFGGEDSAGVTDLLQDQMPDHLLPESVKAGDGEAQLGHGDDGGEFAGFEILDSSDALETEPGVTLNDD